jgi:hypothetical protein
MKSVRKIILAAAAMLISLQAEAQKAPVKWSPWRRRWNMTTLTKAN